DLRGGRLPGHRGRELTPGAVEHADDHRLTGLVDGVDRAARVALLADDAVAHGEPAVVDRRDPAAALPGDDAEVADRLTGLAHHGRILDQHPPGGQHVVHHDVTGELNGLPVGDLVIGGDGGAVRGVVAEHQLGADEPAGAVGHRAAAAAVPR